MMGIVIVIGIALWVICEVIDYGLSFAYLQRKYPGQAEQERRADRAFCGCHALFGPFALLNSVLNGWYGYGFKYRD